jgi:hypothetical protein
LNKKCKALTSNVYHPCERGKFLRVAFRRQGWRGKGLIFCRSRVQVSRGTAKSLSAACVGPLGGPAVCALYTFYSDQMVWECQTETLWASDIAPQWIEKRSRRLLLCPTNLGTSDRQPKDPTLLWLETVDEYASRRLTVSSDVFTAISGLARAVRSRSISELTYAAGIWLEDWRRGILWSSKGFATQRTSDQYIAPSWS